MTTTKVPATIIIVDNGRNASIDKLVRPSVEEEFDGKHIWVQLNMQIDWVKGCGFIYRNFRGSKKTLKEALEHLYSSLNFFSGEWKLETCEADYISYTRGNSRELITRYNLDGPTIFDMNH